MAVKKNRFSDTAIIIGAGAHVPYGFPTAKVLTEKIIGLNGMDMKVSSFLLHHDDSEEVKFKKRICKCMLDLKVLLPDTSSQDANAQELHFGKKLDEFVTAFAESQVYSIDTFLAKIGNRAIPEEQKFFLELGKFIIAYFIRYYELKNRVGFSGFDWIQYIINNFLLDRESCEIFFKSPPKIYTFNYDTFLERSVIAHLVRFHGSSETEAIAKVVGLNITHIYGSIQSIGQQNEETILTKSMENIKVIDRKEQVDFTQISRTIADNICSCRSVYFLGYGFDGLNNEILFRYLEDNLDSNRTKFCSTSAGLSGFNMIQINSDLGRFKIPAILHSEYSEIKCMHLISNLYPIFL